MKSYLRYCLFIFAFWLPELAYAQLTGVRYTIAPQAEGIRFAPNSALEDNFLYGGTLGIGLGRYIELQGSFTFNPRVYTNFSRMEGFEAGTRELLELLPQKDIAIQRMGGSLRFNLTSGSVLPYLTLGIGTLHFIPENVTDSWRIYISGALGLQYTFTERYALNIAIEHLTYQINVASAFLTAEELQLSGLTPEDFETRTVNNLGIRLGLQMYLGGIHPQELTAADRALQAQLSGGIRHMNLHIEPFYGLLRFHRDLNLQSRHELYGAQAGLNFGPYAGIRGLYFRDKSWKAFQGYGGEFRLNFRSSPQETYPFLSLGGGYLDILPDYPTEGLTGPPENRPFALAGIGLHMALSKRVYLSGAIRTLLTTTDELTTLNEPSDIKPSWFYSAGISVKLGRSPKPQLPPPPSAPPASPISPEIQQLQAQLDSLQQLLAQANTPPAPPAEQPPVPQKPAQPSGTQTTTSPRVLVLPVPNPGELYVRYGPPGGVTIESLNGEAPPVIIDATTGKPVISPSQPSPAGIDTTRLRQWIRQTIQQELHSQRITPLLVELERKFEARFRRIEEALASLKALPPGPITVPTSPTQPSTQTPRQFNSLLPFTGISIGFGTHVITGIRAEFLNPLRPAWRFTPDLAYGISTGENLFNVNGNGLFMPDFWIANRARPYAGAGLGLLDAGGFEMVFNLILGSELRLPYGQFYVEFMTQDFFDGNRFSFGYRFNL